MYLSDWLTEWMTCLLALFSCVLPPIPFLLSLSLSKLISIFHFTNITSKYKSTTYKPCKYRRNKVRKLSYLGERTFLEDAREIPSPYSIYHKSAHLLNNSRAILHNARKMTEREPRQRKGIAWRDFVCWLSKAQCCFELGCHDWICCHIQEINEIKSIYPKRYLICLHHSFSSLFFLHPIPYATNSSQAQRHYNRQ